MSSNGGDAPEPFGPPPPRCRRIWPGDHGPYWMRSSTRDAGTAPGRITGLHVQSLPHNEGGDHKVHAGRDIYAKIFNATIDRP